MLQIRNLYFLVILILSQSLIAQKKILVFYCAGGAGHIAVKNGLNYYLSDYIIESKNLLTEVLHPLDPVKKITFGFWTGEDFYNYCLKNRWPSVISRLVSIGSWSVKRQFDAVCDLIDQEIDKTKPDMIISVIPFLNGPLAQITHKRNLPFIVLTNDLDTTNYICNLTNAYRFTNMKYTIAFKDKDILEKIIPAKLLKSQIVVTGFPIRPSFLEQKRNKKNIRETFSIPENKPAIMILMGGTGSMANYKYVKTLSKSKLDAHLIVCIGRNEKIKKLINKIKLPQNITISVVGFTDQIADLMSVSDLLITKSGPNSICEAMSMNLPMIIDRTERPTWWEELNITFVKKHKIADVITSFRHAKKTIEKYIKDKKYRLNKKRRLKKFKKEDYGSNIKKLVDQEFKNSENNLS